MSTTYNSHGQTILRGLEVPELLLKSLSVSAVVVELWLTGRGWGNTSLVLICERAAGCGVPLSNNIPITALVD
jgi:hypothetical protein